jgi:hypothetical protein
MIDVSPTGKEKAEANAMGPVAQRLAEYHNTVAGIRTGLAQAKKGLGGSVNQVFDAMEQE